MKKKEMILVALIAIVSVLAIVLMKNVNRTPAVSDPVPSVVESTDSSAGSASAADSAEPAGSVEGSESSEPVEKTPTDPALVTVDIYHGTTVIKSFNPSVDNEFEIKGDYGIMHVEVKDGKWHVMDDVECPNKICTGMGWMGPDDIIPISCLPNDVYVVVR